VLSSEEVVEGNIDGSSCRGRDGTTNASCTNSSVQFVMSQRAVNAEIISMIEESTTTLTFISMMSQHSDPDLRKAIEVAASRGVDVMVYHNINPYVPLPPTKDDEVTPKYLQAIPMHGKRLWNFISTLLGSYVDPMHANVTHARFIVNDTHAMFGGVDFNKVCESDSYVQHAIKVSFEDPPHGFIKDDLDSIVRYLRVNKMLHEYQYSMCLGGSIIGSSAVCESAVRFVIGIIQCARKLVFIENQYFQHPQVLNAIAKRKQEVENIEIILVGNDDFTINPYHPGKDWGALSMLGNFMLWQETQNGLNLLSESDCQYQYRTYPNKYTHNKIFIADDILVVGTFNLHERSLKAGNDFEIGIVLKNQKSIIDAYIQKTIESTILLF
jgi:phosphatidylserine/phosphatidylglycerophosphate/cardiolipin synthase-like enzyme